jgi:hypothetical protein
VLNAGEIEAALDDLARLRITVFADWPYLYEGDPIMRRAISAASPPRRAR